MANGNFSKPTVDSDYLQIMQEIRNNMEALAVMFAAGTHTNLPEGSIRFTSQQFQALLSNIWTTIPISLEGGGTGATDAAGARAALNAAEKGTGSTQTRTNEQNDTRFLNRVLSTIGVSGTTFSLRATWNNTIPRNEVMTYGVPSTQATIPAGYTISIQKSDGTVDGSFVTSVPLEPGTLWGFAKVLAGTSPIVEQYYLIPLNLPALATMFKPLGSPSTKTLVWSGSATSVDLDTLPGGHPGAGTYFIKSSGSGFFTVDIIPGSNCNNAVMASGGIDAITVTSINHDTSNTVRMTWFKVTETAADVTQGSSTIAEIYKVN